MLESRDYRRILSLLEQTGRASTLESFAEEALEGMQRQFGYFALVLMIAEPTPEGPIATAGAMRGGPDNLDEYFERWRSREPFEHPAARAAIARHGIATLGEFYSRLDAPRREFCRDFLAPNSIRDQLSTHIDTGLERQGFLTIQSQRSDFSPRDRALMRTLRPHLANQLRTLLTAVPPTPPPAELSKRQREVAALASRGLSNAEIAASLGLAESTVKQHLARAFRALEVSTRAQLAARYGPGRGRPGTD